MKWEISLQNNFSNKFRQRHQIYRRVKVKGVSPGAQTVESDCNAGDPGLRPESGSSLGEGNDSILAWRILWREEPGGIQSWGHKELDKTE